MRFLKMIGLVALISALALTAGVGSASGESTLLCKVHLAETCPEGEATTKVHVENKTGTNGLLLNKGISPDSLLTILCLHVLAEGTPLELGTPQTIHATILFKNCGSVAAHNNCEVVVEEQPLVALLRLELDAGVISVLSGLVRIKCVVVGFIKLECQYSTSGLEIEVEGGSPGEIILENTPASISGGALCPEESSLDGELELGEETHILGEEGPPPPGGTALCATHTESCPEKDIASSLHLVSTDPPTLLNTVANVECDESLITAIVLGLGAEPSPQKIDVTKWTWDECHTLGATGNCTVSSESSPVIDLERKELNLGAATLLSIDLRVECDVLGLHEMDCSFGGAAEMSAEGALRSAGVGHGMFTADEVVLEETEEAESCPDSVTWDALYEALSHVYITE